MSSRHAGWVLAAALGACAFQPGQVADNVTIDAMPDVAVDALVLGPWGTPTPVVLPAPTATDDDPSLTDDRLELCVNSSRGGNADILIATRASVGDVWPTPVLVAELSLASSETTPEISADGLSMIFASDRAGTLGGFDLWHSTRQSRPGAWANPTHIPELGSNVNEAAGNMTPDGLMIVFSSERTGNGSPDLFYAERSSRSVAWQAPIEVVAVNTNMHEGSPFISADGLTLYFDTNRDGTFDLYTSHRASRAELFPAPVRLTDVDTAFVEVDPWLSLDGRRLMFVSDRGGTSELWEATR